ncbi:trace amine-associated receptor 6-like [Esox lucius]|uniref:trace amine-associated receptor 6-like n=1 Tax=Esox lucius TaxID=8010 RepID=UPI0014768561|nr:trace amine-associated receptor 6-like [Esox lucius]
MIFLLISAVTVFLNLLVIIAISHFKQLHTPTNLLILSLAVSDLLVGLIVIPANTLAIMEPCWVLGDYFCALLLYITFLSETSSLGNLILISVDRYVAVCDPLMYNLKITTRRTIFCIFISWCCCIMYDVVYVKLYVKIQVPSGCFEECYSIEGAFWFSVFDFLISVIVPCSIIITLYLKIFLVARSQSRKIQHVSKLAATVSYVQSVQANNSEKKAAKTLGFVVFNYLLFWNPIFILFSMLSGSNLASIIISCLPLVNSFINPIIYAFFYPWFKVTAKRILGLK